MAMLADHRVDRLHVRLPAGQAARAEQLRRAVLVSPWPELGDEEIVVVRRIHLQTAWSDLDRTLGERLRAAIAHGERRRFRNGAEVLTELSRDLARGTAGQAWWWQSWSDLLPLPASDALARLWNRHVAWLPDIISGLERTHALADVWRQLTPASAAHVLAHVIAEHQLPWSPDTLVVHAERAARQAADQTIDATSLSVPLRLLRRWHPLLQDMPAADPRTLLALVLDGLVYAPLSLNHDRGGETMAAWCIALTKHRAVTAGPPTSAPPATSVADAFADIGSSTFSAASSTTDVLTPPTATGDAQPPASRSEEKIEFPLSSPTADHGLLGSMSGFAGVVFLINVLRHPHVQELIDTTGWFTAVPHAWHLVVALARHLGWAADDPLALTLEALLEADGTTALATPAIGAALAACAAELYGDEVWNPRLLEETGRFHLTASHFDVWLPLSAVRLPLRLVGLDLTPGWTPWLGRVVTIHFDTTPLHTDLPTHDAVEDDRP